MKKIFLWWSYLFLTAPAFGQAGSLDPSFGNGGIVRTPFFYFKSHPGRASATPPDGNRILQGRMVPYSAYHDIAVQEDGRIVGTGLIDEWSNWMQQPRGLALARYQPQGNLDSAFSGDGMKVVFQHTIMADDNWTVVFNGHSVALQSDGKVIAAGVGGTLYGPEGFAILRVNRNGTLDSSFGTNGLVHPKFSSDEQSPGVAALAIQPDGKILAAGPIYPDHTYHRVVRLHPDGRLDSSFGSNGGVILWFTPPADPTPDYDPWPHHNNSLDMILQPDGKILLAGRESLCIYTENEPCPAGDKYVFAAIRLLPNGAPDHSFGLGGLQTVEFKKGLNNGMAVSVALRPDGRILLAGLYRENGNADFALARLLPGGGPDSSFSGDGWLITDFDNAWDQAYDMVVQEDGKIILAGQSEASFALARYLPDGTPDNSFSEDGKQVTDLTWGEDVINALAIRGDRLYAAGYENAGIAPGAVIAAYQLGPMTAVWYRDADGDGYGNAASSLVSDTKPPGYVANDDDCNDKNRFQTGTEVCDGRDNDCDGVIDNGLSLKTFYADFDGDGMGSITNKLQACIAPFRFVSATGDCNDNNKSIYPGAPELCDGLDNDCDGQRDEGLVLKPFYWDADKDGYGFLRPVWACAAPPGYIAQGGDCNDKDASIHPGAAEVSNGKDDNCNGFIDESVTTKARQKAAEPETAFFSVRVAPNPARHQFLLTIRSQDPQPSTLRITDAAGRVVEVLRGLPANGNIIIGHRYRPGIYFAEVIQPGRRKTLRLVKVP